jgi:hypothetical protein
MSDALQDVKDQAIAMGALDAQCESGYAHLGWLLLEVAEMQYWKVRHETFRDYLRLVSAYSKRSVGQLQQYFLTVRDLIDTFTADQLESMGITKAMRLRAAKDYAIVLPKVVVDAALDPKVTVKELKKIISVTLKMPEDPGDWMDLEMEFMVTPEQRAWAEKIIDIVMHTEPLTKSTISKSAQMWDVFEKLGSEFQGAHCGDGQ